LIHVKSDGTGLADYAVPRARIHHSVNQYLPGGSSQILYPAFNVTDFASPGMRTTPAGQSAAGNIYRLYATRDGVYQVTFNCAMERGFQAAAIPVVFHIWHDKSHRGAGSLVTVFDVTTLASYATQTATMLVVSLNMLAGDSVFTRVECNATNDGSYFIYGAYWSTVLSMQWIGA
jgi:hypothetical protein